VWGRVFWNGFLVLAAVSVTGCQGGATSPETATRVEDLIWVDSSPSWSHDGNFVYYRHEASDVGDVGGIYKVEVYDGWREHVLRDGISQVLCPKACPSRAEVAVIIEGDLHVFDIFDQTLERLTTLGGCVNLDWSPDGRALCLERVDGCVWVVDDDYTRRLELEYRGEKLVASNPVWSPSGESITFVGHMPLGPQSPPAVYSLNLREMKVTELFAPTAAISCLDWDPLGGILALSSTPILSVSKWTAETGGSPEPWFAGTEASWSIGGEQVVYVAPDMAGFLVLWLRDSSEPESEPRQLTFGIGGFLAEEVPGHVSTSQPESR